MSSYKPFRCISIDLFSQRKWNEATSSDEGFYVVLWWRTVPLGDFFHKAGKALSQEIFETRVCNAVLPSLRSYAKDESLTCSDMSSVISSCASFVPVYDNLPNEADASLVICTKDRAESLRTCLQSIASLLCKPKEIIVVDNATKDDSTKRVVSELRDVVYVREDRPGLDIARNTGAKAASRPIVIYTDDDTLLHPHWIYHVMRTFDDPKVVAMTGLVLAHELKTEAQWIFERFWPFNRGYVDRRYDEAYFRKTLPSGTPVWNIGAGANMAFRKSTFSKSGYFDERLDVGAAGCNGDSEIWYRILAGGDAIHYNPRAVVSHFHREAMSKLQSQIFSYMRGFTAAVLIQHQRFGHKGNLRHLFLELPKYYCFLMVRGFPRYRGRFSTIFSEMRGMFSGLIFYLKNRNKPSNIN